MYNGVINVYKEKGYTSHDVVAKMRGILKQKKIGHTGTLDPDAEGVLPVCLGQGTKLCDMLTDKTKTYQAVMLLGTKRIPRIPQEPCCPKNRWKPVRKQSLRQFSVFRAAMTRFLPCIPL